MKAATSCTYSSGTHSFVSSSKNKWNGLTQNQDLPTNDNRIFDSTHQLQIGVSQIQPENGPVSSDCELQNDPKNKSKLRSTSCPEARKDAKSIAESVAKTTENLLIYRLYETARQKKIKNSKKLNNNNNLIQDEKSRRTRKLALVRHAPSHLRQLKWSNASADVMPISKLNRSKNIDENDASFEVQRYASATHDCNGVKLQNGDNFDTFSAEPEVKDAQCSVPADLGDFEVHYVETEGTLKKPTQETMLDATLIQIPDVNATSSSATTSGSAPKSQSKVINIDGICYILTMEPPTRGSFRSNSVASIEVYRGHHNCHRRDPYFSSLPNGAFVNSEMVLQGRVNKELETWYQQRENRSTEVDLGQVRSNDATEPYKIEALDHAALRLRKLSHSLKQGLDISKETLCQNLDYAISVLESNYLKGNRVEPVPPSDEEVLDNLSGETPVPEEIKSWLVETFSNKRIGGDKSRSKKDRRSLRSVVRTVQAGMMFDRISRKPVVEIAQDSLSCDVARHLKRIDKWTFDIFELDLISDGNALAWVCYQLLTKYDLLKRFKISVQSLFAFCDRLQKGYRKHNNRYHNPVHAADVAQTLNCLLTSSGFINWFSDLEIFSMIMAALVHDVEHTGTTNNFHINTRSNLAILYNDRSVLEQHHVSTAFRIMKEEHGCDILENFSRDDYQDCRSLMVEMVLATDMNRHFEQVKNMETALQRPELLEKSKAMCLLLHSCDINHPSKPWKLHYRWTKQLVLEFFDQGDRERKLDLPISPLCDRHSAKIAQSQIGFIDFVVQPTFSTLLHLFDEVNGVGEKSSNHDKVNSEVNGDPSTENGDILKYRFGDVELSSSSQEEHEHALNTFEELRNTLFACVDYNRSQWVKKDKVEIEKKLFGEKSFHEDFTPDPLPVPLSRYLENGSESQNEQTVKDTSLINLTTNNCNAPPITSNT